MNRFFLAGSFLLLTLTQLGCGGGDAPSVRSGGDTLKADTLMPKAQPEAWRGSSGDSTLVLQLPDSSTVYLGRGTQVEYTEDPAGTERNVVLSGEAQFEVKKNTSKKFNVYAGNTKTMVVGTVFRLKAYPDQKDVTLDVLEGQVRFVEFDSTAAAAPVSDTLLVSAQEQVAYDKKTRVMNKKKVKKEDQKKWLKDTGKFIEKTVDDIKNIFKKDK